VKIKTNIYTDGTYLSNNPTWHDEDSPWKAEHIESLLKKNKIEVDDVVDVGCGAGGIIYELSGRMPLVKKFRGYDVSANAIALAEKYKSERVSFNNVDFIENPPNERAGLLLMIDVVEHVEDYYRFMRQIRKCSKYFVFHIPLDLSCRTLIKSHVLLQQRESVGHLHYFSKEMVLWLLKDTGYEIIDWNYTKPITDCNKASTFKRWAKKILRNISFSISKTASDKLWGGYSMLILARCKDDKY
jgi:SAM-dependent methyltransferase